MITIPDIIRGKSEALPGSICCVLETNDKGDSNYLSYESLWRCATKYRQWIAEVVQSVGHSESDRDIVVAVVSSNSVDMLISMLACTGMGASSPLLALLNTRWTASEMSDALQSTNECASTVLICGPGFESTGNEVASMLGHHARSLPLPFFSQSFLQSDIASFTMDGSQEPQIQVSEDYSINSVQSNFSDHDAMIIFTSGTTGGSKGVRLSHRAIAVQSFAKLGHPCKYSQGTTMLASTVPLFHIGGISSCLSVLFAGGKLVFPLSKRLGTFDVNSVQRSLLNAQVPTNTLVVVPAMLVSILQHSDRSQTFPRVRLILIGGQSATTRIINQLGQKFPNASIVQTFACTEAASSLTFLEIKSPENSIPPSLESENADLSGDCVGVPPSHVSIRLYDSTGRATKIVNLPFHIGVIATLGPHIMNGYWKRGTKQGNLEGWLLTSDLGFYDNAGRLYFCGRLKDVIRSGGESILANEVERVLLTHPSISECAVFPRQDEKFGEAVACALVLNNPIQLKEIRNWCSTRGIATYKRPRYLFVMDSLPRNTSGKILKHKLVAQYGRIPRSRL